MSGSDLPYHLRVNKFIERQVFAEALGHIDRAFPLRDYAYISMGGAYLEDFRIVHQSFDMRKLYSFDEDEGVIDRQRVNAPFSFIKCECARSKEVVKRFDDILTRLGATNAIVWLDFTTPKNRRGQLLELRTLVQKLGVGDVVKITLNANPGSLGDQKDHAALVARAKSHFVPVAPILPFTSGLRPPSKERPVPSFHEWRLENLKENLGEFCPPNLGDAKTATGPEGLARLLAAAIQIAALGGGERGVATHPVEPVCAIRYSDGQQMLTVTMTVIDQSDGTFLSRTRLDSWTLHSKSWDDVHELNVPYLSLRERFRIHSTMDQPAGDSHAALEFLLDDDESSSLSRLEQYRSHYLRYPTFVPADL